MAQDEVEGDSPLRDQLVTLLGHRREPSEHILSVLLTCVDQLRNRIEVERAAGASGLALSGFRAGTDLQLYFDLSRERDRLGYISRGWGDPGYRVGDLIEVPRMDIEVVKEHAHSLLNICATRGVVLTVEEGCDFIWLHVDSVIYAEGFNAAVLAQAVEALHDCVEMANTLIGGHNECC